MRALTDIKVSAPAAVELQSKDAPAVVATNANGASAAAVTGDAQPNLIADLTEKLGRTPLKRLEQMIDYDEDQAAAILKQWMRGAEKA